MSSFIKSVEKMLMDAGYSATRTGRGFSIASSEFLVEKPSGEKESVWSPPWNEYDDQEEEILAALFVALEKPDKYERP